MAFDVGFIDDIEPVLVAQLVPAVGARVVAVAHSIDVGLFHQGDVGQHRLLRHHLAVHVVVLMTVHAAHQYRLSVDEQLSASNLHLAEPDAVPGHLCHGVTVLQHQDDGVEVRCLGCPLGRSGHRFVERHRDLRTKIDGHLGLSSQHLVAGRIEQAKLHCVVAASLWPLTADDGRHLQPGVTVVAVQPGLDRKVLNECPGGGVDRHITVNAGHPPVVLILHVAVSRPTDDPDNKVVGSLTDQVGDLKLGRQAGVAGVADVVAVDPQVKYGLHPIEAQHDPFVLNHPGVGYIEVAAVETGGVVVSRDERRIGGDRHLDIGVDGFVVALHSPVAGHGNRLVVVHHLGDVRGVGRAVVVGEVPVAVQRPPVG